MAFTDLCSPALIYMIFSLVQIVLDTIKGEYNTAFMKSWVAVIFTILLNYLCSRGLDIISWIIVFIPFIMMTVVISILLLVFGLNPTTGKSLTPGNSHHHHSKSNYVDARAESAKLNNNVVKSSSKPVVTHSASYNTVEHQPEILIRRSEKIVVKETEKVE